MSQWLFGPESMTWRINRESVLLLGGRAALLMQLAHPLVAAAVANHSDFRRDPLGRLRRTLDTMLSIIFGTTDEAERVVAAVDAVHGRVQGRGPGGARYDARDPHLLLWVYSTLVDSSIRVYEWFVAPLEDDELARYYDETKVVARMFGVPERLVPETRTDLEAWMGERVESGEVRVTPLARELAAPILRPLPLVPRRLAEASALVTTSLLPPAIRSGYGLKLGRARNLALVTTRRASKLVVPRIPGGLRAFPAARRAEALAGGVARFHEPAA